MWVQRWQAKFHRTLAQWRYDQIVKLNETELPFNRTWRVCQSMLKTLSPATFAKYTAADGMVNYIRTPWASIDNYTQRLKDINRLLMENQTVPTAWVNFNELTVLADLFFLDSERRYQAPAAALAAFIEEGIRLCELVSAIEDTEESTGSFNERLLIRFFMKLKETLMDLHHLQISFN